MLSRPIVAFDIETVPDFDVGRRILGIEGDDRAVVNEMLRRRRDETNGASDFLKLPWHRVVCICATILDPARGHAEVRHLGGDAFDEASHLEGFFHLVTSALAQPRIVSWNGAGFDLPVMRYRSLVNGVAAPGFYKIDGELQRNKYQNRFHDLHVDVMDVLASYGASERAGLGTISKLLGIPSKGFLERAIYEHVLGGEVDRVVEYCKLDTIDTMLVFLVWAFHIGRVSREELVAMVDAVRAAIGREGAEGWRAIAAGFEGWPAWSRRPPARAAG
jgi:predicted PolB exonuclease-like 3'-5' exonuclease